jgi:hypothetical protein
MKNPKDEFNSTQIFVQSVVILSLALVGVGLLSWADPGQPQIQPTIELSQ